VDWLWALIAAVFALGALFAGLVLLVWLLSGWGRSKAGRRRPLRLSDATGST